MFFATQKLETTAILNWGLIVVYSVLPEIQREDHGGKIRENDFTLLVTDPKDGEIMNFSLDSRFFEKVEVK